MKNSTLLLLLLVFNLSCQGKEEINPIKTEETNSIYETHSIVSAPLIICDECTSGLSGDSAAFGYKLSELNSGWTAAVENKIQVSTASLCFKESNFMAKDAAGADILTYNFTEHASYISGYNKNTIHNLSKGYQTWFVSNPWFKESSVYFWKDPQAVTNARFKVNCINYIRTDCNNYSYYYANILLEWETPGKRYSAIIKTVITIYG